MASEKKLKTAKSSRHGRRQIPSKKTINFANQGEKPLQLGIAIPAILLIFLAAAAFSKFLVIDRMAEVAAAEREVAELQSKVDTLYRELDEYDDLSELYAHYTYSGFTSEELNRAERTEVIRLIRTMVLPWSRISNWAVSGNLLTINLRGESLQQINLIAQQLEEQNIVDYCTVNTANSPDARGKVTTTIVNGKTVQTATADAVDNVNATIQVYLNSEAGVSKNESTQP